MGHLVGPALLLLHVFAIAICTLCLTVYNVLATSRTLTPSPGLEMHAPPIGSRRSGVRLALFINYGSRR